MTKETQFTSLLLKWNSGENNRSMPWKNEKNPYRIWISEIILQQTRVLQGTSYYNRFIQAFPTVFDVANAEESEVFKLWEGLGYYSRCKNIIFSARHIANKLNGIFPESYEEIIKLKGIGTYTASAIASFAYNQPYAVVDGNVFRVLSRVFGISISIDSNQGKKIFTTLAGKLLDKTQPGIYNQSLMDFGATICKPQLPICISCPLNSICYAFQHGLVNQLPIKQNKIARKSRWFYYLVISYNNNFYVRKRMTKDIWQNLYEFVLVETTDPVDISDFLSGEIFKPILNKTCYNLDGISNLKTQFLTHQVIKGRFINATLKNPTSIKGYDLVTSEELKTLPFPKFITTYLKD